FLSFPLSSPSLLLLHYQKEGEMGGKRLTWSAVYEVLMKLLDSLKKEPDRFFRIVKAYPVAYSLMVTYCKEMNPVLLKELYYYSGRPEEYGHLLVQQAYADSDFEKRIFRLQTAME